MINHKTDGDITKQNLHNKQVQRSLSLLESSTTLAKADYVSSALIPEFSIVTKTGYLADSANVNHRNIILGVDINGVAISTGSEAIYSGIIENLAWSWSGDILFLNGMSLSITPPTTGFCCEIAKILSSTSILIDIKKAILL